MLDLNWTSGPQDDQIRHQSLSTVFAVGEYQTRHMLPTLAWMLHVVTNCSHHDCQHFVLRDARRALCKRDEAEGCVCNVTNMPEIVVRHGIVGVAHLYTQGENSHKALCDKALTQLCCMDAYLLLYAALWGQ